MKFLNKHLQIVFTIYCYRFDFPFLLTGQFDIEADIEAPTQFQSILNVFDKFTEKNKLIQLFETSQWSFQISLLTFHYSRLFVID